MWPWKQKPSAEGKLGAHQHARYQSLWYFRGTIYVPSIVRTADSGYFLEREPVIRREPSRDAIEMVLAAALKEPPIIREPNPIPASPVPAVAGEESLNRFHKGALGFGIYDYIGGDWEIGATAWPKGAARIEVVERVRIARVAFPTEAIDTVMAIAERWPVWRT